MKSETSSKLKPKSNGKYKYLKEKSILYNEKDEYSLTKEEFCRLYAFYVTYSMCGSQSMKKRTFIDYGWDSNNVYELVNHHRVKTKLGNALCSAYVLNNDNFCFISTEDDLSECFRKCNLLDGRLVDYDTERAVIKSTQESNKYMKLFYRVRDGFAHGKFILKYSSNHEKMIIIQDDDSSNVTARIVLKLSTLLKFIEVIDLAQIIDLD
ncbi:hypothetical protein SAMN02910456_01118 [Ruminococcaceae bacterium YRB3002]|nr:hypothetical protein SAMN02910456_01118 [Ruminococcaceae bacterium YRB3002]